MLVPDHYSARLRRRLQPNVSFPNHTHTHTPEQLKVACQCGKQSSTSLGTAHNMTQHAVNASLLTAAYYEASHKLFSHLKRVHLLLRFLEEMGARAKPWTSWDPE
ncbi:hypothetical protein BC827DRAFT_1223130 [Russula dissimulans]|nr:hypothetical protein BC827DRAFT_1223130 [Russula dissimulans]